MVSRTNAWVARFARYIYDPEDIKTHIWKYFDFIFLDEAHSIVTDATFADSSFDVWRFMSWVATNNKYDRCEKCGSNEKCGIEDKSESKDKSKRCKVILMSGTPDPFEQLIPKETRGLDYFNYLDYFEICNHVEPKKVVIRQEDSTWNAAKVIRKYYKKKKRVIYFASSITHIIQLIKDLSKQGITETDIGVSFTDETKKDEIPFRIFEKKKEIEDSLMATELLPDDVKIFLTTTKNKEGINIQNKDIKVMFAESSQSAELTQMAGRVRKGLNELNIMYELARNYNDIEKKWNRFFGDNLLNDKLPSGLVPDEEQQFDKKWLDHINYNYSAFTTGLDKATAEKIIEAIEKSFLYVRYDFFRQKFLPFLGRMRGEDLARDDRKQLEEWVENWSDEWVDKWGNILSPGMKEFQKWFPYSTIILAEKPPTDKEIAKRVMDNYFKEHSDLLERKISKDERDKIVADLNALLKEEIEGHRELSQPNSLLKKGDYKVVDVTTHKKREKDEKDKNDERYYTITRLDEAVEENS